MAGVKRGGRGQVKFEREARSLGLALSSHFALKFNSPLPPSLLFVWRPRRLSNNHPTKRISQFIDYNLKHIVCTLNTMRQLIFSTNLPTDFPTMTYFARLMSPHFTLTSLTTKGLTLAVFPFNDKHIPTETICELLRMSLTRTIRTFNGRRYLQKHGATMGTKMALSFANFFLAKFEHDALRNAPY